jgi:hypothetical protein
MVLFIATWTHLLKTSLLKKKLQNVFTIITFVNDEEKMWRFNINLAISGI